MPLITEPEAVLASFLYHPIVWPHGVKYYQVETSRRYNAIDLPMLRDAAGQPLTLTEELGIGSVVQIALDDAGLMKAVKIIQRVWDDPFAQAA
jgi:hypothetical protein